MTLRANTSPVLQLLIVIFGIHISIVHAQTGMVGINTKTPQTTLDVTGAPADANKMDGIIAPRLTGEQLHAKTYTSAQVGTLVYVTLADPSPAGQTERVKYKGYFYFDSSQGNNGKWLPLRCCGPNGGTIDGCGNISSGGNTITDIDGNVYKTVTLGTQTWLTSDLKTTKYNDGTAIENITNDAQWSALSSGAYCWYDNDAAANKCTYGALYNWYAINTGKLCPSGWHVPSDAEWTALENYLADNGYNYDGSIGGGVGKIAKSMAKVGLWQADGGEGTVGNTSNLAAVNNKSGLSAVPGGARKADGIFFNKGDYGGWWSPVSNSSSSNVYFRFLGYNSSASMRSYSPKTVGFSVRCVMD